MITGPQDLCRCTAEVLATIQENFLNLGAHEGAEINPASPFGGEFSQHCRDNPQAGDPRHARRGIGNAWRALFYLGCSNGC